MRVKTPPLGFLETPSAIRGINGLPGTPQTSRDTTGHQGVTDQFGVPPSFFQGHHIGLSGLISTYRSHHRSRRGTTGLSGAPLAYEVITDQAGRRWRMGELPTNQGHHRSSRGTQGGKGLGSPLGLKALGFLSVVCLSVVCFYRSPCTCICVFS